MTLAHLPDSVARRRLADPGLFLRVGPLTVRVCSTLGSVNTYLRSHYGHFPLEDGPDAHFTIDVGAPQGVRRWIRPQVVFRVDGHVPFYPLPASMASAMFEWGFNWCIARRVHHLLVLHSAVVSRGGRAVLLPAQPEAGKSTLSAALVAHGWEFASDEFALVDVETGAIHAMPRPISLKNGASDIIAARWPAAQFSPDVFDLEGVRIRYLRPPIESAVKDRRAVDARWIAIPQYRAGWPTVVEPMSRARMLAHLADSSYNFSQFGRRGWDCLAAIVEGARSFTLTYSNIDEALAMFDRLSADNEDPGSRASTAA